MAAGAGDGFFSDEGKVPDGLRIGVGRLRIDHLTFPHLLDPLHHDPFAGLQPFVDNPLVPDPLAGFDIANGDLVVGSDDRHLVGPLQFGYRALGDQQSILPGFGQGAHAGKLPRPEEVPGIGKERGKADGACLDIHLPIGKIQFSPLRKDVPIRQNQFEHHVAGIAALLFLALHRLHILLLTDGKVDLDGIDCGNGGELTGGAGSHQVAELHDGRAGDAVDGRHNPGEIKIQPGLFHCGFGRLHSAFGGEIGLDGVIQFLLTDGAFPRKGGVALDIQFRLAQFGLGHG